MADIVKRDRGGVLSTHVELAEAVRKYAQASQADNTRRAYEIARREFEHFCTEHSVSAWPAAPETVAAYLSDLAERGYAYATIVVHRAAIATFHRVVLLSNPAPTSDPRVRAVMTGIRRTKGTSQKRRDPITWASLTLLFEHLGEREIARLRDKAIILFGITTALRGDEIRRVEMSDVRFYPEGIAVSIRKSKTDQTGRGRVVRIPRLPDDPLCPVMALEAWLRASKIVEGPVFRGLYSGGQSVRSNRVGTTTIWEIVKSAARRAGLDPKSYGAHSLRAGFVTSARARGVSWGDIMQQTGHKQLATVMKYDRPEENDGVTWDRLRRTFTGA